MKNYYIYYIIIMGIYSINFNSANKSSGSNKNPNFVLEEQINDITGIKVKSVMIPISTYTFDSRNNKIYFIETTNANIATITPGIYNSSNITSAVASALDTAGAYTYNVSYFSSTNNLSISATSGSFSFQTGANQANYELGISSSDLNTLTTSVNLSDTIDLSGLKQIHIASNIQAVNVYKKPYNILASIPLQEQQNSIAYYTDYSQDYINTDIKTLSEVRLSLFDENFREIQPSKDFSIQINFLTK